MRPPPWARRRGVSSRPMAVRSLTLHRIASLVAPDGLGAWRRARGWRRFRSNRVAVVASVVLVAIVCFVLAASQIAAVTGYSAAKGDLRHPLLPPFTGGHLLGTDSSGRDLLVRLSYGGRTSLLVAGVAAATTLLIGGFIGSVSGYSGGWVDSVLMRIVDVLLALPGLSILILVSVLYQPGTIGLALLLAGLGWTGIARLVRGEVLSLRSRDYVDAARITGATDLYIIRRHVVPNVMPTMVVWTSLAVPGLVLTEAGLSFLGFGVRIPTPSWGNMLEQAKDFYSESWTNVFIPGCMIYVTVLAISLIGNGLRDALDPRNREVP